MKSPDQVLKLVRLTEKSNKLSATFGQYTFEVFSDATKHTVREAVERAFKVKVTRVNLMNNQGKATRGRFGRPGFKSDYKKAVVTLKQGDKIELI